MEYSEPRTDARLHKKNFNAQEGRTGRSPLQKKAVAAATSKGVTSQDPITNAELAQDSAERAFFELQDAKVNFFQEKTEHEDKMEKRKQNQTFTNGFYRGGDNTVATNTTFASSTQENSANHAVAQNGNGPVMASRSNGFSFMNRTQGNRFGDKPLISDEKDLKSDVADLSRDELKERLIVAEKVMKTLFKRNKDLEEHHLAENPTPL